MESWHWALIVIAGLLAASTIPYLILKYACHKSLSSLWRYLGYIIIFWAWIFAIFETPKKRRVKLKKAGVKEGQVIVDLGCGPGRFTILASRIVGQEGKVYALDIHPLNTAIVAARIGIEGVKNVSVILTDCCATGLPNNAIDLVFINDSFHEFNKLGCLKEASRILKPDGILAIDEAEMKESKFLSIFEQANLFTLVEKDKRLYKFRPLINRQ